MTDRAARSRYGRLSESYRHKSGQFRWGTRRGQSKSLEAFLLKEADAEFEIMGVDAYCVSKALWRGTINHSYAEPGKTNKAQDLLLSHVQEFALVILAIEELAGDANAALPADLEAALNREFGAATLSREALLRCARTSLRGEVEFWCEAKDWSRLREASTQVFDDLLRSPARGVDTELLSWASWSAVLGKTLEDAMNLDVGRGTDAASAAPKKTGALALAAMATGMNTIGEVASRSARRAEPGRARVRGAARGTATFSFR